MAVDYTDKGFDPESGLTLKQRLFCDCYLTHMCLTKAYREAGYTSASFHDARKCAKILIDTPDVRSFVDMKMKERTERLGVSADATLRELAVKAFANVQDYRVNPDTGSLEVLPGAPKEAARAVKAVKWRRRTVTRGRGPDAVTEVIVETGIELWDPAKYLHLLCLHLGLVSAELPPLEVLLNRLPPPVASILRQLLAAPPGQRLPPPTEVPAVTG